MLLLLLQLIRGRRCTTWCLVNKIKHCLHASLYQQRSHCLFNKLIRRQTKWRTTLGHKMATTRARGKLLSPPGEDNSDLLGQVKTTLAPLSVRCRQPVLLLLLREGVFPITPTGGGAPRDCIPFPHPMRYGYSIYIYYFRII